MEGFVVLDTENNAAVGDKPKIQKATKASIANAARQKLGDISNFPQKTRTVIQDDKSQIMPIPIDDYINQLQTENKTLLKIIEERNKLIEVTVTQLKKLKINLQKMQQQNLQLAQSNSQLLAELNSGKERLKALQHELGCQNGLLKAKNLELQVTRTNYNSEKGSMVGMEGEQPGNTKRKPKSKSLGSSRLVETKDRNDTKRPCTRRQSAKFEHGELKPADDFFPTDVKISECQPSNDSLGQESGSTSVSIPLKEEKREDNDALGQDGKHERSHVRRRSARLNPVEPKPSEDLLEIPEEKVSSRVQQGNGVEENGLNSTCSIKGKEKEGISVTVNEAQEFRRCSVGRPSRQAAKKIQTYKEIPINIKMRRMS